MLEKVKTRRIKTKTNLEYFFEHRLAHNEINFHAVLTASTKKVRHRSSKHGEARQKKWRVTDAKGVRCQSTKKKEKGDSNWISYICDIKIARKERKVRWGNLGPLFFLFFYFWEKSFFTSSVFLVWLKRKAGGCL